MFMISIIRVFFHMLPNRFRDFWAGYNIHIYSGYSMMSILWRPDWFDIKMRNDVIFMYALSYISPRSRHSYIDKPFICSHFPCQLMHILDHKPVFIRAYRQPLRNSFFFEQTEYQGSKPHVPACEETCILKLLSFKHFWRCSFSST